MARFVFLIAYSERMSVKKVVIAAFFTARQLISLDALPKSQKFNQEHSVQSILPSLPNEAKRFSRQKTTMNYSVHMDNLMRHNRHRVVDELPRLKILRAPHPPCSPDMSPCDFRIVEDFKVTLKDRDLQSPEEIFTTFRELCNNITFDELQMGFERWRDRLRWITEHDRE
jgi:hypothetical protein